MGYEQNIDRKGVLRIMKTKYSIKTYGSARIIVFAISVTLFIVLETACVHRGVQSFDNSGILQSISKSNSTDDGSVHSFSVPISVSFGDSSPSQSVTESNSDDDGSANTISELISEYSSSQSAEVKADADNNRNNSLADGYALSLTADSSEALLNGYSVILPNPPFIQNDTFYIPLEEVTELLGGTYFFDYDIAIIKLYGHTTQYQIGSHSIVYDGEAYMAHKVRYSFGKENDEPEYVAVDEKYAPILYDGTVFIPFDFKGYQAPEYSSWKAYPASRMVINSRFSNDERSIGDVRLRISYDDLSSDFKSKLNYAGVVCEVINYNVEEYKNDGLSVYVMRINKPPYDDVEGMDGRVCAIKVSGNHYSTPRGLKPGDSEDRLWRLYGNETFTSSFYCTVEGGKVSSIVFHTNYYGVNLNLSK
jgi:hypothetical protein